MILNSSLCTAVQQYNIVQQYFVLFMVVESTRVLPYRVHDSPREPSGSVLLQYIYSRYELRSASYNLSYDIKTSASTAVVQRVRVSGLVFLLL